MARRAAAALVVLSCSLVGALPAMAATPRPRRPAPAVKIPAGVDPPTKLKTRDLIVPKRGRRVRVGDTVRVDYRLARWSDGRIVDSSWRVDDPFAFTLGAGQVIPGFDRGIRGMRVGGRRRIEIPPRLAYGEQGSPPDIPPDETLVFVVDLRQRV